MCIISKHHLVANNSAAFLIGKMKAEFEYKLIEDIDDNLEEFITELIYKLGEIADKLEEDYFNVHQRLTTSSGKTAEGNQ
jgi:uncharacterized alpha-E superfamily protein